MKHRIYLKSLFSLFLIFSLAGCSLNNTNLQKKEEIVKKEEPKKREEVSAKLILRIKQMIKAISQHNISLINKKFINPKFGIYNLYKLDGINTFNHQKIIYNIRDEEKEELSHIIKRVEKQAKDYVIIQQDLKFDCSPFDDEFYGWNGDGLYLSVKTKTLLSDMIKETNKYQKNRYSKEELEKVQEIENFSYKVILTPDLSFYVTKIDNQWYMTLFDRITMDCSSPKSTIAKGNK